MNNYDIKFLGNKLMVIKLNLIGNGFIFGLFFFVFS